MGLIDFFFGDYTPGYELLTQDNWAEIIGPDQPSDGFESLQKFEEQFFIGGNRSRGFIVGGRNDRNTAKRTTLGQVVKKPNKKPSSLFIAAPNDLANRQDCINKNGKWYCTYTEPEYKAFKLDLSKRMRADEQAKSVGKTLNPNTKTYDTEEKTAAQLAAFADVNRRATQLYARMRKKEMKPWRHGASPKREFAQLKIKDAQQILLNYMDDLVEFQGLATGGRSHYDEISAYTGDPTVFFNMLTSPPAGRASSFVTATPTQLGALVPKVEFYEVTADPTQQEPKDREKIRPIYFPDYSSGKAALALGRAKAAGIKKKDMDEILSSRGSVGTDVGVREFHWTYDNKDMGQNVLKASLTLYFGSAADIINPKYRKFMFMNGTGPKPNSQMFDKNLPGEDEATPSQQMAILKGEIEVRTANIKKRYFEENSAEEIKDKNLSYQTLRIIVGWARPEGANLPKGLDDDFLSSLSATQRRIDLNLTSYKLSFQQEGQVELQLSYVGSMGAVLADGIRTDVLSTAGMAQNMAKKEVPINLYLPSPNQEKGKPSHSLASGKRSWPKGYIWDKARKEKMPLSAELYSKQFPNRSSGPRSVTVRLSSEGVDYELTTLLKLRSLRNMLAAKSKKEPTEAEKAATKELDTYISTAQLASAAIEEVTRKARYSAFIDRLFVQRKLRVATLKLIGQDVSYDTPTGRLHLTSSPKDIYHFIPYEFSTNVDSQEETRLNRRMKNAAAAANSKEKQESPATTLGYINPDAVIDSKSLTPRQPKDRVRIYYLRFGDIIDAALKAGVSREDYGVVLGSIAPHQVGSSGTPKMQNFSIAEIPISIEYFGQWFLEKIVNQERMTLSFRDFTVSLLKDLLEPVLAQRIAAGSKTFSNVHFDFTVAHSYNPLQRGLSYTGPELKEAITPPNFIMATKPAYHYFVVGTHVPSKNKKGNRSQDEADGIYHLVLGADRGLVKTWSFSEKKMPYLRAMNISNANFGKALVLPQDVSLTMIGNTLFQNGQLIYINADMGLGTVVARELNLGGYYRVVKSENTITPAKYETNLTCMWESSPWRGEE